MSTRSTQVVSTLAVDEVLVAEDRAVQGDGGLDPLDDQLVEGPPHPGDGLGRVGGVDDQLAQQRVVVGRNGVARLDVRVPPHARAAGDRSAVIRPGEGGNRCRGPRR